MKWFRKEQMCSIQFLSRRISSQTSSSSTTITKKPPRFQCTNHIPQQYKSLVVEEAQNVLREYLHCTKSLPFFFSDLIARNSPSSLSNLVRNVRFSAKNFSESLRKLLRYEPINEFEFFLESIGIDDHRVHIYLPRNSLFFSENRSVLDSALALSQFGFPWNTLGKLYEDESSVFRKSQSELTIMLFAFKEYSGFENLTVAGICLAFPHLLGLESESDLGAEVESIFDNLKRVFEEFNVESCVEGNVEAWYHLCCKVRVFYDLGCDKGIVSESMCAKKETFLRCPLDNLVQKVEYFSKFGSSKADVGMFLLQRPEILDLDFETPMISASRVLEQFGLDENGLKRVCQKYSHVLGRNEMANLPCVMRALDLNQWFFDRVKNSSPELFASCVISRPEEDSDRVFVEALNRIKSLKRPKPSMRKLEFLKEVGFGENATTVKISRHLRGTRAQLLERFDCFLELGVEYSKVCLMIRAAPLVLSQSPENLREKVGFMRREMGLSLEHLNSFPAFVCYDLNRIKFRHGFYVWLREKGFCEEGYCISTVMATSEKEFIAKLSAMHPAAPKQYLECFFLVPKIIIFQ